MRKSLLNRAVLTLGLFLFLVGSVGAQCEISFGFRKSGKTVKFINTSAINLNDADRFVWSFGDGERSKRENPTHVYDRGGTYKVCLVVEDSSCGVRPVRYCSEVVIAHDGTDCMVDFAIRQVGEKVNFINKSNIKLEAADRFVWVFGDGERSNELSPVHVYKRPKKYKACLAIKDENCGSGYLKQCKPVVIEPDSNNCKLSFRHVAKGLGVKFKNTSGIVGDRQLVWDFGDGSKSKELNPSHRYKMEGTYKVCLTARDSACGGAVKECVGITLDKKMLQQIASPKIEIGFSFKMFPNPATNIVYLESADWIDEKVGVRIFNTLGKEVFNKIFSGEFTIPIDFGKLKLANGIHLLEVRSNNRVGLEKLIIR